MLMTPNTQEIGTAIQIHVYIYLPTSLKKIAIAETYHLHTSQVSHKYLLISNKE